MRFNMLNGLNLARTRRFVALVVRPRPDTRGAHIPTLKRRRRNPIDRQAHHVVHPRHVQHARYPHVVASRSHNQKPLLWDRSYEPSINDVKNEAIPPESETTTSFSSLAPLYNSSTRSELDKPRILRSSRSRKCKSISDIHTRLSQLKETPGPSTWPRLRDENETTFSLSSSAFSLFSSQEALEQQCQNSIHATSSHGAFMRSLVTPARHSPWQEYNQSARNTDDTEYVTANTHLEQSLGNEESSLANVSILQAIDRSSGAIFERIHQGRQGEIGAQIVARLLGFTSHVAVEPVLAPLHSNKPSTPVIEPSNNCPDRPALMLTIPTPALPHSPLFVPQSPITVSKFFFATALSTPRPDELASDPALPLSSPLAPSLTSCGHCGLPEFDQGTQCRLCNERWLACKVWYRANDGGHRRWLTEPYIRPGECNETNRAMMRGLGVAGLSSTLCSLDDVYLKRSKRNSYLPRLSGENIWRSVKNKAMLACSLHKPPLRRASKRLSQIRKTDSRFSSRQKDLIES